VPRFIRDHSLTLFFFAIFLAALTAQALVGHDLHNQEAVAHGGHQISLWRYVTGSDFGNAVMENWQSEYLQFTLLMIATIWLVQRGSPESKELGKSGRETDEDQKLGRHSSPRSPVWARTGGLKTAVYSNSLLIAMLLIFLGSWFAQSVTGWTSFNAEQTDHHEATLSYLGYIGSSSFWEQTLQNWQSEFLAVGSFAALAIFLRQRGSPESKPVGAPHDATGVEG
jgi:hypothetical protein